MPTGKLHEAFGSFGLNLRRLYLARQSTQNNGLQSLDFNIEAIIFAWEVQVCALRVPSFRYLSRREHHLWA